MKRGQSLCGGAAGLLIAISIGATALAQKQGGTLRVHAGDSPPSLSMHEEIVDASFCRDVQARGKFRLHPSSLLRRRGRSQCWSTVGTVATAYADATPYRLPPRRAQASLRTLVAEEAGLPQTEELMERQNPLTSRGASAIAMAVEGQTLPSDGIGANGRSAAVSGSLLARSRA
jgi:hypothetical protein